MFLFFYLQSTYAHEELSLLTPADVIATVEFYGTPACRVDTIRSGGESSP